MINLPLDEIKEKILDQTSVDEDELDEQIQTKLDQLSGLISEEGAAHIVANENDVTLTEEEDSLKIDNLASGMQGINIPGRVVQAYELRTFENDRGEGQYAKFLLGDETGITMVVMWGDTATNISKIEEDDTVLLKDVSVREGRRGTEIHANEQSEIDINPDGITIDAPDQNPTQTEKKQITNLGEDDSNVEIFATIVQIFEPKYFERDPESKRKLKRNDDGKWENPDGDVIDEPEIGVVLNIYADDGTDSIRVVLWKQHIKDLLSIDEDELIGYRDNLVEFEPTKTDLLGEMVKLQGRVQRNDVTDKLELVADNVITDVDPSEELVPDEDNTSNDEPVEDTASDDTQDDDADDETEDEPQDESPDETETDNESDEKEEGDEEEDEDDLLSLEDIEDIEEDI
jgi:hypothetical protein